MSEVKVNVTQAILQVLAERRCSYLLLKQLLTALPEATRAALGIQRRATATQILLKLRPHLGSQLEVYQKARSVYIGYKLAPEELLLQTLQQHPAVSPGQLQKLLPMSRRAYLPILNGLLEIGRVQCTFTDTRTPRLTVPSTPRSSSLTEREKAAFYQAYLDIGQGRSFVRIHRIREALAWSTDDFNRVLTALTAEYSVELHGGDPSTLTAAELRHSFTDAHGLLYIALSWRRSTA